MRLRFGLVRLCDCGATWEATGARFGAGFRVLGDLGNWIWALAAATWGAIGAEFGVIGALFGAIGADFGVIGARLWLQVCFLCCS